MRDRRHTRRRASLLITAGLAATVLHAPHVSVHAQDVELVETEAPGALSDDVAYLERRVELATGDSFYLLLDHGIDQGGTDLKLMYGGAILQSYPVHSVSIGRPRVLFVSAGEPIDWRMTIWNDGTLSPPRPELPPMQLATDDEAEAASPVLPPTAEEAIPVPARFLIRFDGGLALEVRSSPDQSDAGWWVRQRLAWARRWQDVRSALSSDRDAARVLVTLDHDAAGALYRALPPETKLLVSSGAAPP